MRKQYHFRPGERGLRAWDVDRLVASTRHLEPESVPLACIREIDESYWGAMTCREVAEHAALIGQCDPGFPIILSSDGRVMDGMHRVLKALMQGASHIKAVRFAVDPEPDYVGVSPEDLPYEEDAAMTPAGASGPGDYGMEATLYSVITCPQCGATAREEMPTDACIYFYQCKGCLQLLRPVPGDCCVFCSFGSFKCPPVQRERGCCPASAETPGVPDVADS
jgi:hypothetical protein